MALQPPHTGPQLLPEASPRVSARDRLTELNKHFVVIHTFARDLGSLTQVGGTVGNAAMKQVNVDNEPTMTEAQHERLAADLTVAIEKVMDLHSHMQTIVNQLAMIAKRPLPPNMRLA